MKFLKHFMYAVLTSLTMYTIWPQQSEYNMLPVLGVIVFLPAWIVATVRLRKSFEQATIELKRLKKQYLLTSFIIVCIVVIALAIGGAGYIDQMFEL
ncbi:MAG: hypothetical protein V4576_03785 [Patescibacteria group bacterium]